MDISNIAPAVSKIVINFTKSGHQRLEISQSLWEKFPGFMLGFQGRHGPLCWNFRTNAFEHLLTTKDYADFLLPLEVVLAKAMEIRQQDPKTIRSEEQEAWWAQGQRKSSC